MKHIYACFCLFLLSNVVTADNHILTLEQLFQGNIMGAFGQKLGAVVDEKLEFVGETSTGALKYEFKPEKPDPMFKNYFIYATPVSKVIYQIVMSGRGANCIERRKILKAVLDNKYSSLKRQTLDWAHYFEHLDGRRTIWLYCEYGEFLGLKYLDVELEARVVEEKTSQVDKSNF